MKYDKAVEVMLKLDGLVYWHGPGTEWEGPICDNNNCGSRRK